MTKPILNGQCEKILEALALAPQDGITLQDIYELTDVPAASASAAIRHMRIVGLAKIESLKPAKSGPWTYRLETTT